MFVFPHFNQFNAEVLGEINIFFYKIDIFTSTFYTICLCDLGSYRNKWEYIIIYLCIVTLFLITHKTPKIYDIYRIDNCFEWEHVHFLFLCLKTTLEVS